MKTFNSKEVMEKVDITYQILRSFLNILPEEYQPLQSSGNTGKYLFTYKDIRLLKRIKKLKDNYRMSYSEIERILVDEIDEGKRVKEEQRAKRLADREEEKKAEQLNKPLEVEEDVPSYTINDPIERAIAWAREQQRAKEEIDKLKENETGQVEIGKELPNVDRLVVPVRFDYIDLILKESEPLSLESIAADYGVTPQGMIVDLAAIDFSAPCSDTFTQTFREFVVNKEALSKGYLVEEQSKAFMPDTMITQRGRLEIYLQFKDLGVLPCIEEEEY